MAAVFIALLGLVSAGNPSSSLIRGKRIGLAGLPPQQGAKQHACHQFMITTNGTLTEDDISEYLQRWETDLDCQVSKMLEKLFESSRGQVLFQSVLKRKQYDVAVCEAFVRALSLVSANHLEEELCASEEAPLGSAKIDIEFCVNLKTRRDMLEGISKQMEKAGEDFLKGLVDTFASMDEPECSKLCSGFFDSALCNGYLMLADFLASKMEDG